MVVIISESLIDQGRKSARSIRRRRMWVSSDRARSTARRIMMRTVTGESTASSGRHTTTRIPSVRTALDATLKEIRPSMKGACNGITPDLLSVKRMTPVYLSVNRILPVLRSVNRITLLLWSTIALAVNGQTNGGKSAKEKSMNVMGFDLNNSDEFLVFYFIGNACLAACVAVVIYFLHIDEEKWGISFSRSALNEDQLSDEVQGLVDGLSGVTGSNGSGATDLKEPLLNRDHSSGTAISGGNISANSGTSLYTANTSDMDHNRHFWNIDEFEEDKEEPKIGYKTDKKPQYYGEPDAWNGSHSKNAEIRNKYSIWKRHEDKCLLYKFYDPKADFDLTGEGRKGIRRIGRNKELLYHGSPTPTGFWLIWCYDYVNIFRSCMGLPLPEEQARKREHFYDTWDFHNQFLQWQKCGYINKVVLDRSSAEKDLGNPRTHVFESHSRSGMLQRFLNHVATWGGAVQPKDDVSEGLTTTNTWDRMYQAVGGGLGLCDGMLDQVDDDVPGISGVHTPGDSRLHTPYETPRATADRAATDGPNPHIGIRVVSPRPDTPGTGNTPRAHPFAETGRAQSKTKAQKPARADSKTNAQEPAAQGAKEAAIGGARSSVSPSATSAKSLEAAHSVVAKSKSDEAKSPTIKTNSPANMDIEMQTFHSKTCDNNSNASQEKSATQKKTATHDKSLIHNKSPTHEKSPGNPKSVQDKNTSEAKSGDDQHRKAATTVLANAMTAAAVNASKEGNHTAVMPPSELEEGSHNAMIAPVTMKEGSHNAIIASVTMKETIVPPSPLENVDDDGAAERSLLQSPAETLPNNIWPGTPTDGDPTNGDLHSKLSLLSASSMDLRAIEAQGIERKITEESGLAFHDFNGGAISESNLLRARHSTVANLLTGRQSECIPHGNMSAMSMGLATETSFVIAKNSTTQQDNGAAKQDFSFASTIHEGAQERGMLPSTMEEDSHDMMMCDGEHAGEPMSANPSKEPAQISVTDPDELVASEKARATVCNNIASDEARDAQHYAQDYADGRQYTADGRKEVQLETSGNYTLVRQYGGPSEGIPSPYHGYQPLNHGPINHQGSYSSTGALSTSSAQKDMASKRYLRRWERIKFWNRECMMYRFKFFQLLFTNDNSHYFNPVTRIYLKSVWGFFKLFSFLTVTDWLLSICHRHRFFFLMLLSSLMNGLWSFVGWVTRIFASEEEKKHAIYIPKFGKIGKIIGVQNTPERLTHMIGEIQSDGGLVGSGRFHGHKVPNDQIASQVLPKNWKSNATLANNAGDKGDSILSSSIEASTVPSSSSASSSSSTVENAQVAVSTMRSLLRNPEVTNVTRKDSFMDARRVWHDNRFPDTGLIQTSPVRGTNHSSHITEVNRPTHSTPESHGEIIPEDLGRTIATTPDDGLVHLYDYRESISISDIHSQGSDIHRILSSTTDARSRADTTLVRSLESREHNMVRSLESREDDMARSLESREEAMVRATHFLYFLFQNFVIIMLLIYFGMKMKRAFRNRNTTSNVNEFAQLFTVMCSGLPTRSDSKDLTADLLREILEKDLDPGIDDVMSVHIVPSMATVEESINGFLDCVQRYEAYDQWIRQTIGRSDRLKSWAQAYPTLFYDVHPVEERVLKHDRITRGVDGIDDGYLAELDAGHARVSSSQPSLRKSEGLFKSRGGPEQGASEDGAHTMPNSGAAIPMPMGIHDNTTEKYTASKSDVKSSASKFGKGDKAALAGSANEKDAGASQEQPPQLPVKRTVSNPQPNSPSRAAQQQQTEERSMSKDASPKREENVTRGVTAKTAAKKKTIFSAITSNAKKLGGAVMPKKKDKSKDNKDNKAGASHAGAASSVSAGATSHAGATTAVASGAMTEAAASNAVTVHVNALTANVIANTGSPRGDKKSETSPVSSNSKGPEEPKLVSQELEAIEFPPSPEATPRESDKKQSHINVEDAAKGQSKLTAASAASGEAKSQVAKSEGKSLATSYVVSHEGKPLALSIASRCASHLGSGGSKSPNSPTRSPRVSSRASPRITGFKPMSPRMQGELGMSRSVAGVGVRNTGASFAGLGGPTPRTPRDGKPNYFTAIREDPHATRFDPTEGLPTPLFPEALRPWFSLPYWICRRRVNRSEVLAYQAQIDTVVAPENSNDNNLLGTGRAYVVLNTGEMRKRLIDRYSRYKEDSRAKSWGFGDVWEWFNEVTKLETIKPREKAEENDHDLVDGLGSSRLSRGVGRSRLSGASNGLMQALAADTLSAHAREMSGKAFVEGGHQSLKGGDEGFMVQIEEIRNEKARSEERSKEARSESRSEITRSESRSLKAHSGTHSEVRSEKVRSVKSQSNASVASSKPPNSLSNWPSQISRTMSANSNRVCKSDSKSHASRAKHLSSRLSDEMNDSPGVIGETVSNVRSIPRSDARSKPRSDATSNGSSNRGNAFIYDRISGRHPMRSDVDSPEMRLDSVDSPEDAHLFPNPSLPMDSPVVPMDNPEELIKTPNSMVNNVSSPSKNANFLNSAYKGSLNGTVNQNLHSLSCHDVGHDVPPTKMDLSTTLNLGEALNWANANDRVEPDVFQNSSPGQEEGGEELRYHPISREATAGSPLSKTGRGSIPMPILPESAEALSDFSGAESFPELPDSKRKNSYPVGCEDSISIKVPSTVAVIGLDCQELEDDIQHFNEIRSSTTSEARVFNEFAEGNHRHEDLHQDYGGGSDRGRYGFENSQPTFGRGEYSKWYGCESFHDRVKPTNIQPDDQLEEHSGLEMRSFYWPTRPPRGSSNATSSSSYSSTYQTLSYGNHEYHSIPILREYEHSMHAQDPWTAASAYVDNNKNISKHVDGSPNHSSVDGSPKQFDRDASSSHACKGTLIEDEQTQNPSGEQGQSSQWVNLTGVNLQEQEDDRLSDNGENGNLIRWNDSQNKDGIKWVEDQEDTDVEPDCSLWKHLHSTAFNLGLINLISIIRHLCALVWNQFGFRSRDRGNYVSGKLEWNEWVVAGCPATKEKKKKEKPPGMLSVLTSISSEAVFGSKEGLKAQGLKSQVIGSEARAGLKSELNYEFRVIQQFHDGEASSIGDGGKKRTSDNKRAGFGSSRASGRNLGGARRVFTQGSEIDSQTRQKIAEEVRQNLCVWEAPNPGDIDWANLDTSIKESNLVGYCYAFLVFFILIFAVTPVTIAEQLLPVVLVVISDAASLDAVKKQYYNNPPETTTTAPASDSSQGFFGSYFSGAKLGGLFSGPDTPEVTSESRSLGEDLGNLRNNPGDLGAEHLRNPLGSDQARLLQSADVADMEDISARFRNLATTLLAQYFPTITLMLINGCVVPSLVYYISDWQRYWSKQRMLHSCLSMNFYFMFVNLIIVPLLGVDSASAVLWFGLKMFSPGAIGNFGGMADSFISQFHTHVVRWRLFALKYLISTLMLGSVTQLLQAPQIVCRAALNLFVVTNDDTKIANAPFDFDFGYWYAYNSILFTLALIFGLMEKLAISNPFSSEDSTGAKMAHNDKSTRSRSGPGMYGVEDQLFPESSWEENDESVFGSCSLMFLLAAVVFFVRYLVDKYTFIFGQFANVMIGTEIHRTGGIMEKQTLLFYSSSVVVVSLTITVVFLHFGSVFQSLGLLVTRIQDVTNAIFIGLDFVGNSANDDSTGSSNHPSQSLAQTTVGSALHVDGGTPVVDGGLQENLLGTASQQAMGMQHSIGMDLAGVSSGDPSINDAIGAPRRSLTSQSLFGWLSEESIVNFLVAYGWLFFSLISLYCFKELRVLQNEKLVPDAKVREGIDPLGSCYDIFKKLTMGTDQEVGEEQQDSGQRGHEGEGGQEVLEAPARVSEIPRAYIMELVTSIYYHPTIRFLNGDTQIMHHVPNLRETLVDWKRDQRAEGLSQLRNLRRWFHRNHDLIGDESLETKAKTEIISSKRRYFFETGLGMFEQCCTADSAQKSGELVVYPQLGGESTGYAIVYGDNSPSSPHSPDDGKPTHGTYHGKKSHDAGAKDGGYDQDGGSSDALGRREIRSSEGRRSRRDERDDCQQPALVAENFYTSSIGSAGDNSAGNSAPMENHSQNDSTFYQQSQQHSTSSERLAGGLSAPGGLAFPQINNPQIGGPTPLAQQQMSSSSGSTLAQAGSIPIGLNMPAIGFSLGHQRVPSSDNVQQRLLSNGNGTGFQANGTAFQGSNGTGFQPSSTGFQPAPIGFNASLPKIGIPTSTAPGPPVMRERPSLNAQQIQSVNRVQVQKTLTRQLTLTGLR